MLRLLNYKCVSNAKLLLKRQNLAETRRQEFYTLLNQKSSLFTPLSKFN